MVDEPRNTDIWKRFDDHANAIAEVRSGQAATGARLENLEQAVDTGFRTLSSELRNLSDRVNQPPPTPNYGVYVAVAFGLLGMFGAYSMLITNPIKELVRQETSVNRSDIVRIYEQVDLLQEHRQRTARLEATSEIYRDQIKDLQELMRNAQYDHGYNRGQIEALNKRLDEKN